jgi:hypothetical protein
VSSFPKFIIKTPPLFPLLKPYFVQVVSSPVCQTRGKDIQKERRRGRKTEEKNVEEE